MNSSRFCILCMLLTLVSSVVTAATRSGALAQQASERPGGARPSGNLGPLRRAGVADNGYRGWSYNYGYTQQRGGQPASQPGWSQEAVYQPPRAEVILSEASAYVQQPLLYTARLTSSGDVRTVDSHLAASDRFTVKKLEGPVTQMMQSASGTQVVTDYYYALTPLNPGHLQVPAATLNGDLSRGGRSAFRPASMRSPGVFELQEALGKPLVVRPAEAGVGPWLPLYGLRLRGRLRDANPQSPGEVFSFQVTLDGRGSTGEQLPSVSRLLRGDDFKIYLERSETSTRVDTDAQLLIGKRVETYTVVPRRKGALHLPDVVIPWWNVRAAGARQALMPGEVFLSTVATAGSDVYAAGSDSSVTSGWGVAALREGFWAPLGLVMALLGAFWFGAWMRGSARLVQWRRQSARVVRGVWAATAQRVWMWRYRLNPAFHYRRIRHQLMASLPDEVRVWYCLRCIACEDDPSAWCQLLQIAVCKFLDLPVNTPVREIAEALVVRRPQPSADKVRGLVDELEQNLYGTESLDFNSWKEAFRRYLRPGLLPRRSRELESLPALPALNPAV